MKQVLWGPSFNWVGGHRNLREAEDEAPGDMTEMSLAEVRRGGDRYLIRVAGEVDLGGVERLSAAIARGEGRRLVFVDLSRCEFMDSSAIGMVILANLRMEKEGRRLAVIAPGAEVLRVLEMTGLADRDLVFADERAARAALAAQDGQTR